MADIYKSVHENQLRNRLQILHVIDVDSANISKAFATDIKKAKDSAKEVKIRKVMKEFKEGTLKSSSGELVTDRKQAIAIAISEADNIEKSDDADSDSSEESIEKAQKANIGDIHVWGGKRYKKIGEGKWVEVSEHGMTKKEHKEKHLYHFGKEWGPKYLKDRNVNHGLESSVHFIEASKLSNKEHSDEEVGIGKKNKDNVQKSVFDEIQENIEKSLNSISTKVSEEILNDIEKSVNHKYFKREGTPGNYKYYYTEEEYMKENNV